MKKKKIVLAGGTGFIGSYLRQEYEQLGYEVLIISRIPGHISWEDETGLRQAVEGADLVVNLAGKSVNCRYTEKNKALLYSSRIETTKAIGQAISQCHEPPALWINSSSATIYRHAEDRPMTEKSGEIGSGFSIGLVKAWEKSFFSFELSNTRQVALRISIVLGQDGGALRPYVNLVKFGMGGPQGNGKQMFSWIHIHDLFQMIRFIENDKLVGVFNASAPVPVSNRKFMEVLRRIARRGFGCPLPGFLLKFGAVLMGTETELLLKSRWVIPERLLQSGFVFKFPEIERALEELLAD